MARVPERTLLNGLEKLGTDLGGLFDPAWYRVRYRDVETSDLDPLNHFLAFGAAEGRDPNRWFDSAWYVEHYPDVAASGMVPLLHYLQCGAAELRNPHPRFDASWYASQHPEAARNPLLHHLRIGAARGYLTERPIDISDYLPSTAEPFACPATVTVDVVIPAYRGLAETRRCIETVLADPDRPPGRVIVIDDRSPEPALSRWLAAAADAGRITLLRNGRNLGFVASANRGMQAAAPHDAVLLNSDTEVPPGWLRRLAAQAYAAPRIASVSPFSNNATICSYPHPEGGPIPFGASLRQMDAACRAANSGRSVDVPTTVGFCMYIRRAALDDVGAFDESAFGQGYGEENDFCLRASARGWRHRLACDTFVYHRGARSFGERSSKLANAAMDVLTRRYPNYRRLIAEHVNLDSAGPYRLAITAALFHHSRVPVILMLSHGLGGGVHRHVQTLVEQLAGKAHLVLLEARTRGAVLAIPAAPGHPELTLPEERIGDLVRLLRSFRISRAHVHHLLGMDLDARKLLYRLGVPFDVTVHDYFAICPQVNLLPWKGAHYCGEPGPAECNACIAHTPSHSARNILSWRSRFAWLFKEAERVLCPSEDVRARLARFDLAQHAIVVPHEPVEAGAWPLRLPRIGGGKLRIAVLGVLAAQKGAPTVLSVAAAAGPGFEFHLIGYPEDELHPQAAARIAITGEYDEPELPALLARVKPHVVWFPAQWPETYSYTLTTAIDAGLPIVATRIGAFSERLARRPMTWLLDPRAGTGEWLAAFEVVRAALRQPAPRQVTRRNAIEAFYPDTYLQPVLQAPAIRRTHIDLRRPGRIAVVAIPERLDNGALSPCAYIRLLLPLDHPEAGADCDVVLADVEEARRYQADIIATQRYAVPGIAAADRLIEHCRQSGAKLLYDIDDDLLHIPPRHPDAAELRPKAKLVQKLLRAAGAVWVSTHGLAERLQSLRSDTQVIANGLDERLWCAHTAGRRTSQGKLRLLCMGTATHDDDLALIMPALERINAEFGSRVAIDLLGVTAKPKLPDWINRLGMPVTAAGSYPGFVNWITQNPVWDIGLAPLADTPFNRCKSPIKALDYAALGIPVVASDVEAYRGSLAETGGMLAVNTAEAWYVAISRLLRDPELRKRLGTVGLEQMRRECTLASQADQRRAAWQALLHRPASAARGRRTGQPAAA